MPNLHFVAPQNDVIYTCKMHTLTPVYRTTWGRNTKKHLLAVTTHAIDIGGITGIHGKVESYFTVMEEYILYKGNPFEHVFIFLSINVSST